ncbi:MAG TPA: HD domain-containing phosphohydrolase [Trueperaceae bacterium]|nr:HD domain-containing phosphohydrolase [Trueperaceae bacterium]
MTLDPRRPKPVIRVDRPGARLLSGNRGTKPAASRPLTLGETLAALSHALDVSEGHEHEHALRTAVIGLRVGRRLGLPERQLTDLYHALLLKDLGASANSAQLYHLFGRDDARLRRALRRIDLERLREGSTLVFSQLVGAVKGPWRLKYLLDLGLGRFDLVAHLARTHAERGARLATEMGLGAGVAAAIAAAAERWDGSGAPAGAAGEAIPLAGRIVALAQAAAQRYVDDGTPGALELVRRHAGTWFDPDVVAAFEDPHVLGDLDDALRHDRVWHALAAVAPREEPVGLDDEVLSRVAEVFGRVIDAKSAWTVRHSSRVREVALGMFDQLEPQSDSGARRRALARGASLHDVGTLGVSNAVLEKGGALDEVELEVVRRHTAYGEHILSWADAFAEVVPLAAGHHERPDGRGYHGAVPAELLPFDVRLLAVADQFEALTAPRPHREAFSPEEALSILAAEAGTGVDAAALAALERYLATPAAQELLGSERFDPEEMLVIA